MTESHPNRKPSHALAVRSLSRVTETIRRQQQADVANYEEEATYVVLTTVPEPLTRGSQTGFLFQRSRWRSRSQNGLPPVQLFVRKPRNQSVRRPHQVAMELHRLRGGGGLSIHNPPLSSLAI